MYSIRRFSDNAVVSDNYAMRSHALSHLQNDEQFACTDGPRLKKYYIYDDDADVQDSICPSCFDKHYHTAAYSILPYLRCDSCGYVEDQNSGGWMFGK